MHRPSPARRAAAAAVCSAWLAAVALPVQAPPLRVVRNVRLELAEDAPRMTLVLRDGRIESVVGADAELPAGALETDGKGALVVPAFIDAGSRAGLELPEPVVDRDLPVPTGSDVRIDMREANRKGIRPSFRAAAAVALGDEAAALRKAGFGAVLVAPWGDLLSGTSALLATREAATRDALIVPDVSLHGAFTARGDGFPSTLMGYLSQLRQFFLDARRDRVLHERYAAGAPDPRPPVDDDFAAVLPLLDGTTRLICEADGARDIERWLALAADNDLRVAVSGGREAWKLADVLVARDVPVILSLDWGEEVEDPDAEQKPKKGAETEEAPTPPDTEVAAEAPEGAPEEPPAAAAEQVAEGVPEAPAGAAEEPAAEEGIDWIYTEPLEIRRERRRLWLEGRDCALRLQEAGVPLAFGSAAGSPGDLLDRVRKLVAAGLPREAALSGLTDGAARLLGVADHLGSLEPGHDATFGLWSADPLADDAELSWLFVDGFPYEFDLHDADRKPPDEGLDPGGSWDFEYTDEGEPQHAHVVLEMTAEGDVRGTLTRDNPLGEGTVEVRVQGFVSGSTLELKGTLEVGDVRVEFETTGELTADTFEGHTSLRGPWGEDDKPTKAKRVPEDERTGEAHGRRSASASRATEGARS